MLEDKPFEYDTNKEHSNTGKYPGVVNPRGKESATLIDWNRSSVYSINGKTIADIRKDAGMSEKFKDITDLQNFFKERLFEQVQDESLREKFAEEALWHFHQSGIMNIIFADFMPIQDLVVPKVSGLIDFTPTPQGVNFKQTAKVKEVTVSHADGSTTKEEADFMLASCDCEMTVNGFKMGKREVTVYQTEHKGFFKKYSKGNPLMRNLYNQTIKLNIVPPSQNNSWFRMNALSAWLGAFIAKFNKTPANQGAETKTVPTEKKLSFKERLSQFIWGKKKPDPPTGGMPPP